MAAHGAWLPHYRGQPGSEGPDQRGRSGGRAASRARPGAHPRGRDLRPHPTTYAPGPDRRPGRDDRAADHPDRRGAATKIVTRREDGSYHFTPYSAGEVVQVARNAGCRIAGLARVIEGLGSHDFPIRGSIHDDVRDQDKLRRQLVNFGGRDGATPCQWAMLDLDKVSEIRPSICMRSRRTLPSG